MTTDAFHYEVEHSELDKSQDLDSRGTSVTTIKCHGKIVIETRDAIEEIFTDVPFTGRVVMDLSDVDYIDSAGLGALIRLKMSAVKKGSVSVDFVKMTPRILQLLKITNLTQWFTT
jgi:anti-anti-sigma factor